MYTIDMAIPPYFKQQKLRTCSLACLRMALGYFDITVTEKELETKIEPDYGKNFKNLWNTTIAKLACEYGLDTTPLARNVFRRCRSSLSTRWF